MMPSFVRKIRPFVVLAGALLVIVVCAFLPAITPCTTPAALQHTLAEALTTSVPLPRNFFAPQGKENTAIYVLGGSQDCLIDKYRTAAELYRAGIGNTILVLSRKGITDYDHKLHRNLTNDEWSLKELIQAGIAKKNIEFISMEEEFFGTLTEAREVARIAHERNYRYLAIVTSQYHTARTWLSFSKYVNHERRLAVYASRDCSSSPQLLVEYFKLILYKYIVLPLS
jgi:uncharacterized SAM-binding protein YcdF (DUF218 family)